MSERTEEYVDFEAVVRRRSEHCLRNVDEKTRKMVEQMVENLLPCLAPTNARSGKLKEKDGGEHRRHPPSASDMKRLIEAHEGALDQLDSEGRMAYKTGAVDAGCLAAATEDGNLLREIERLADLDDREVEAIILAMVAEDELDEAIADILIRVFFGPDPTG